ncbi:MAG: glutamate synthase-related protein [Planctomycetota bacterium]
MIRSTLLPEFKVRIDPDRCVRCKRCTLQCGFGVHRYDAETHAILSDEGKCVACLRCETFCPNRAIEISPRPSAYRPSGTWSPVLRRRARFQAETGGVLLTGSGTDLPYPVLFDHLLLDACQVTNPSIDPLREPMELRTYLGAKPDAVALTEERGKLRLKKDLPPQVKLELPVIFGPMSLGAVSLNVQKSLALAAREMGTLMNTGEGGLHPDLYPFAEHIVVQCASGRFGVNEEYLKRAAVVEIKIGQGAKPGIGGHLPGEKVDSLVASTRMIPVGADAISPAPHHDIYSIEDLRQLIFAIKEATDYAKPVCVKIAAVHNVAAIAGGVVRAGADIIYIDGFRGGTGATPTVIRDHIGIPVEIAIAVVDDQLRREGLRNRASIIAGGTVRSSADLAKAIALGADAVGIATAALIALGCTVCQKCYTGCCSWGLTTQKPELVRRVDPARGATLLANLLNAWAHELKEILGALGVNAVESLRGSRERLRGIGLDAQTLEILDVKPAGRGC